MIRQPRNNPRIEALAKQLQAQRESENGHAAVPADPSATSPEMALLSRLAGLLQPAEKAKTGVRSPAREWMRTAKPGDVACFPQSEASLHSAARDENMRVSVSRSIVLHGSIGSPICESFARIEVLDSEGKSLRGTGSVGDGDAGSASGSIPPEGDDGAS